MVQDRRHNGCGDEKVVHLRVQKRWQLSIERENKRPCNENVMQMDWQQKMLIKNPIAKMNPSMYITSHFSKHSPFYVIPPRWPPILKHSQRQGFHSTFLL